MGLPFISKQAKKRDHIVAVDLGGRTTKTVHLHRKSGRFELLNYSIIDAPAYEKGFSPDVLAEHLREVVRTLGATKVRHVTLALGVNDSQFRQVELPLIPLPEMRQMLKLNSKNYLQQDLADHVFDCFIAGTTQSSTTNRPGETAKPAGGAPRAKVMVGCTRKQLVDDLQAAVKAAGLIPDQVVPGMIAPTNAFEMAEPEIFAKEVAALVEIGFKSTTITIVNAGEIVLTRVVAIGGDRLTSGLAEAMGISYSEAENIKVGMPGEVQQSLDPLIHPLGRELRASIDFFEHQADKTVSQVFVSGGSSRSEYVLQALQGELMVPCKNWSPTRFLRVTLPPEKAAELEQLAPQLTVAVGAAAVSF
ncbi:MAG TPA: pilus assembly protein PilM [Methylomirabilota bacterium]|nr:pilus assembly protein PilM [Methylomirabilota bacterium]